MDKMMAWVSLCQTQTCQNKYWYTTPTKIPNQNNQENRQQRVGDWLDVWAKTQVIFDKEEGKAADWGLE